MLSREAQQLLLIGSDPQGVRDELDLRVQQVHFDSQICSVGGTRVMPSFAFTTGSCDYYQTNVFPLGLSVVGVLKSKKAIF